MKKIKRKKGGENSVSFKSSLKLKRVLETKKFWNILKVFGDFVIKLERKRERERDRERERVCVE